MQEARTVAQLGSTSCSTAGADTTLPSVVPSLRLGRGLQHVLQPIVAGQARGCAHVFCDLAFLCG